MKKRAYPLAQFWRTAYGVLHFLLLAGNVLSPPAMATEDRYVAGEYSELYLSGLISEGACVIGMATAWQEVELAPANQHDLQHPGDRGQPVAFAIHLKGCSRSGGDQMDRDTGTSMQDAIQPVVTISFSGVIDPDSPALLQVSGITGVGLMLADANRRPFHPGQRGEPFMLMPGDNLLAYTVTPVRTSAPLLFGDFRAVTNFEVSYD